jgi:PAS domain S-box-containing protein
MVATLLESYYPGTRNGSAVLPLAVESLLDALTADAVLVVDPNFRIVHWDPRTESLTGIVAEEALGKACHEVLSGELEDGGSFCDHQRSTMRLARAGRPVAHYDVRLRTRWGQERWVNASNLIVDSKEGPYLVHLLRDAQNAHETLEMARGVVGLSSKKDVPAAERNDIPDLTPRQREVLGLLAVGKSARQIGSELYLSQATVRNHIRALLQALGAHSQLEVLAKARELRIV